MTLEVDLRSRSGHRCELCTGTAELTPYAVGPDPDESVARSVLVCGTCLAQIDGASSVEPDHWRKVTDTMWSQEPAVQVMAWRMLRRLRSESWAAEALDMLYLDEAVQAWAEAGGVAEALAAPGGSAIAHRDSNGAMLAAGDTVTLIKDLNVKGAGFTAKRGTAVRNISLVPDNSGHIEGRVSGQLIVILTEFVKKSG